MVDIPQMNPTLDKMSSRLGYAGSGSLSPILSGLKAKFTFFCDWQNGETFTWSSSYPNAGQVKCYDGNMTEATAKDWSMRTYTDSPLDYTDTNSRDMEAVVTMGDSNLMFTGAGPTRNILQWTSNWGTCRRQFWLVDLPPAKAIYIDYQDAHGGVAYIHVDPTTVLNGGPLPATGETEHSRYWDRNAMFSINILPQIGDESFRQQESFTQDDQAGANALNRGWGNRYANSLRNWGGVKTVEVILGADEMTDGFQTERTLIPETNIEDVHGYFCGPLTDEDLGQHLLTFRLRAAVGSSTYLVVPAYINLRRFPCPS